MATIDVHSWFSRALLDAYVGGSRTWFAYRADRFKPRIGAGAFDYDFGAVENTDNKFTKSYLNLACGPLPF